MNILIFVTIYMHWAELLLRWFYASYGYLVLMIIPCFWLFYAPTIIPMLIIYKLCFLIDEADRTSVGYVCLWEGTSSRSKFLHLFNPCYHMFGRSSEVSLSKSNDINMENMKDNSGCYNLDIQRIDRAKTITYQELCIYSER